MIKTKESVLATWKSDLVAKEIRLEFLKTVKYTDKTKEIQEVENDIEMLENIISDAEFEMSNISHGSQAWDY